MSMPVDEPANQERRALAAIVFTDVVGFSRHSAGDEARTFAAMNRDFALFTRVCGEFSGRVANTAGDSMLMVFGSAVEAMQAALAIQAHLHAQAKAGAPGETLEHRIGVHIGDVILNGTNVFGDGVNVASRIQEICRPGAIAYSRAVSEIVQGKVETHGIYLGPRRAKNIGDAIPIWEIPPIATQERARMEAAMVLPMMSPSHDDGLTGRRSVVVLTLAALVLAGGVAIVLAVRASSAKTTSPPVVRSRPKITPRRERPAEPSATNSPETATNAPVPEASGANAVAEAERQTADLRNRFQEMKARYDFDGILALLATVRDGPMSAQTAALVGPLMDRYRILSALRQWADAEVRAVPAVGPLDLGGGEVLDTSSGEPMIRGNDGPPQRFSLWTQTPDRVDTFLNALNVRPGRVAPAPNGAITAFEAEYGLAGATASESPLGS